jgi:alkylation response protein AidB-like acyl-CoA dehydrogenase
MRFLINEVTNFDAIKRITKYASLEEDLILAILEGSANFTENVLAPLNTLGDSNGVKVENGTTLTAPGFKEAYAQYAADGWPSLPMDAKYGGQELPELINTAAMEMVMSSNLAFSLCPMLTQGAMKTIQSHGSGPIIETMLNKLALGEWTGAMDLTEPQAGSDLSTVKTRAVPESDGETYRIYGQKIFISWGDHDMADNVVHLVLARLPDAPAGTKGVSLFAVPKFRVDQNAELQGANDITTVSTEEKLGQHGSPTCVLSYGDNEGSIGYLLGAPNKGLACMFTMMNHARINVGMQGLGLAERAYQQGKDYANERVQGGQAIIHYPDVQRMVKLMGSGCSAMRAMIYTAMSLIDLSESEDSELAAASQKRLQLITPIVKSWCTDLTQEITSLNIQIHGGMGFVEETGAAQYYRDARILPIYEGTNAIQANDLIGRKMLLDEGAELNRLYAEIQQSVKDWTQTEALNRPATQLSQALTLAQEATALIKKANAEQRDWQEIACAYLDINGYLVGAWLLNRKAAAAEKAKSVYGDDFCKEQLANAVFFGNHYLSRVDSLHRVLSNILN